MEEAINTNHLSMEKLLVHTIYIRTKNRLAELTKEIKSKAKGIQCKYALVPSCIGLALVQEVNYLIFPHYC